MDAIKADICSTLDIFLQEEGHELYHAEIDYTRVYPATINTEEETKMAINAAKKVAGPEHVDINVQPSMGSEDFAFMLQEKPGCYMMIGNGGAAG